MGVKHWLERMRGRLQGAGQDIGRKYLVPITAAAGKWIFRHRVWISAILAIGLYLLISQYLYDLIGSHYQRHPPEQGHLRIDNLSFWDRDSEGARNLIFAIGGWLGVLAAIVGFVLAGFRTSTQLQMTQTAIDSQVTERFTKAVEQLGHEQRAVRLGAIYALERIASDSPRDRYSILETLAAYIREHAPWPPLDSNGKQLVGAELEAEKVREDTRPAIDIGAALSVICRLLPEKGKIPDPMRLYIDLRHTNLRGLDAQGINLSAMHLEQTNLSRSHLNGANLRGTNLFQVDLSASDLGTVDLRGADLRGASLSGAMMFQANMSRADLSGADLSNANLYVADMSGANLSEANLSFSTAFGAVFVSANMSEAKLCGSKLIGADMSNANLFGADLALAEIDMAYMSHTRLQGVQGLTQKQFSSIRYLPGKPPFSLPEGLTLPEPFDL